MDDYEKAENLGLTDVDRWEEGINHHPMSERLMRFLCEHDSKDHDCHFDWRTGGDNGDETLMYQMDTFFELLDTERQKKRDDVVTASEEDYQDNIGEYVKMASNDKMVVVLDENGKTLFVLGRGAPRPEARD